MSSVKPTAFKKIAGKPSRSKERAIELTLLQSDPLLRFRSARYHAELGSLYSLEIAASFNRELLDLSQLLGESVCLRFHEQNGSRDICGMICSVEQSDRHNGSVMLKVVPRLWKLSRRTNCRIFQHQTVSQIVESILREYGTLDFDFRLTERHRVWEYCVQYRETDLAFIQRMIEHEGITLWFDHSDGRDVAIFADTALGFGQLSPSACLPFIPPDFNGGESVVESPASIGEIQSWTSAADYVSSKISLESYDYVMPSKPLEVVSTTPVQHPAAPTECYDFHAIYDNEAHGRRYSTVRAQELSSVARAFQGQTSCRLLDAGLRFELQDPTSNLPSTWRCEYLVKSITITCSSESDESGGDKQSFLCRFESQPVQSTFRPRRLTPWPSVVGPQYAVVTGAAGSEIHTDKLGRVKVKFKWDRHGPSDDRSSCWLRSTQAWAGNGWGGIQVPRVGQEVVVEFTDGDPNRPVITGRIYNGESMPPVSGAGRDAKKGEHSPQDMIQAAMQMTMRSNSLGGSGGHNEITMHDTGGEEKLFIRAQKDEVHRVQNDRNDTVGHDEVREVVNDRTRKVGKNESVEIGVDEKRKVGANQNIDVGKNIKITAGDSITLECGLSKLTMNSAGVISLSGTMITIAGMANVNVAAPMTNVAGAAMLNLLGALTTVTGSTVQVTGSGLASISGGKLDLLAPGKDLVINGAKVKIN